MLGTNRHWRSRKWTSLSKRVVSGAYDGFLGNIGTEPFGTDMQLSDLNPGTAQLPNDDNSLIATGNLTVDSQSGRSHAQDLYPDSFGKLSESRMVVNDQLYVVGESSNDFSGTGDLYCVVRIKARIVKLSTKDWMAIAIQSTAADN